MAQVGGPVCVCTAAAAAADAVRRHRRRCNRPTHSMGDRHPKGAIIDAISVPHALMHPHDGCILVIALPVTISIARGPFGIYLLTTPQLASTNTKHCPANGHAGCGLQQSPPMLTYMVLDGCLIPFCSIHSRACCPSGRQLHPHRDGAGWSPGRRLILSPTLSHGDLVGSEQMWLQFPTPLSLITRLVYAS